MSVWVIIVLLMLPGRPEPSLATIGLFPSAAACEARRAFGDAQTHKIPKVQLLASRCTRLDLQQGA